MARHPLTPEACGSMASLISSGGALCPGAASARPPGVEGYDNADQHSSAPHNKRCGHCGSSGAPACTPQSPRGASMHLMRPLQ